MIRTSQIVIPLPVQSNGDRDPKCDVIRNLWRDRKRADARVTRADDREIEPSDRHSRQRSLEDRPLAWQHSCKQDPPRGRETDVYRDRS